MATSAAALSAARHSGRSRGRMSRTPRTALIGSERAMGYGLYEGLRNHSRARLQIQEGTVPVPSCRGAQRPHVDRISPVAHSAGFAPLNTFRRGCDFSKDLLLATLETRGR